MAVAAPVFVTATAGQDCTVTVALSESTNVSAWTVQATLRAYHGATAIATKTVGSGITVSDEGNGEWVITFTDTELSVTPGAYVFEFRRTNDGYEYPICDPSAFIIRSEASASTPTLTNLAEFAAWRGESLELTDAASQQYILALAAAESAIERYCDRKFTYYSGTEYYDGTGEPDIMLRRTPVLSVTSVYLDTGAWYGSVSGAFASDTLLTAGEDYVLVPDDPYNSGYSKTGRLRRINGVWPSFQRRRQNHLSYLRSPMSGCLKVTYVSGYSLIPFDLKQAVWSVATQMVQAAERGFLFSSENFEDYGYSLGTGDDAARIGSVTSILSKYRSGRTFVG